MFEDIIGRNFRQPKEGLGFDGSPVAHMWRSMIWPNNFLYGAVGSRDDQVTRAARQRVQHAARVVAQHLGELRRGRALDARWRGVQVRHRIAAGLEDVVIEQRAPQIARFRRQRLAPT